MDSSKSRRPVGRRAIAIVALAILLIGGASNFLPDASVLSASAQPAAQGSVTLGVLFARASYGGPETSYNTVAVENADLDMLLSTNAQCIRMDIGYAPWLTGNQTAINEITSLVQAIKAAGKCLIIADAASESYRSGGQVTWSQFMAAWIPRVETLASLYHPDYYEVIKEPGWYVPLISDATTNPQFQNVSVWLALTANLTAAVHSVSPSTQVGIAIAASSLTQAQGAFYVQYLNQVQTIPGLSFIGFDCYGVSDQTATENYLSANPPSKAVWIPEAWSTATGDSLNGDPSQDASWLQSAYGFAASVHAAFLIPFYTDHFASYSLTASSPTSSAQIISLYQERTPIYSAFQELASAVTQSSTSSIAVSSESSSQSELLASSSSSASASSTESATTSSTSQATHSSSFTTPPPISSSKSTFGLKFAIVGVLVLVLAALVVAALYLRRRN